MDGMQGTNNNEGFSASNLYSEGQQYNSYDPLNNLFPHGAESNFSEGWGVNGDFSNQSRAQPPQPASVPSWQNNNNAAHLTANPGQSAFNNGHASPYARSFSHSPAPFTQGSFANYNAQPDYQYRSPQYDPALVPQSTNPRPYNNLGGYSTPTVGSATIAPQALEHERPQTTPNNASYNGNTYGQPIYRNAPQLKRVDHKSLAEKIPKGSNAGLFQIIDFTGLSQATQSARMGSFVNIGTEAMEWEYNRSVVPSYAPRKSRNELRALAAGNAHLLSKISKKSHKAKASGASSSSLRPFKPSTTPQDGTRVESVSSSDYDSSDTDDDSAYSDDDDDADSPLPAKRPESPKGAVEYDTIKALWRNKRKPLESASIRKGLVDFWEIVKTIRDRWKADGQALSDAEKKKQTGELPLLKSRVKDQRDMIEAAFRAAIKHGHRGIIELFAENVALVFLCYQFLLDRFKDDDCNGPLSRAILETMSSFTTLTQEKTEKTHLDVVIPRYLKKGDAKSQYWLNKIKTNIATASKGASSKEDSSKAKAAVDQSKAVATSATKAEAKESSPSTKRTQPDPVAGVKRAASAAGERPAAKKVATGVSKPNGTATSTAAKANGIAQKAVADGKAKAPVSSAASGPVRKTVVAKPSGFFSSLQSAQKKPGTLIADKAAGNGKSPAATASAAAPAKPIFSFAETMASLSKPKEEKPRAQPEKELPKETPEERAKRLRKEERRKLNVTFKKGDDLVEIRYFTHDPEEEINHDASQVRDLSDVGGEGRMFKQQHQMMDIDEDDETVEEGVKLVDYKSGSAVNFDSIPSDEKERMYAPYGGGELKVTSLERLSRDKYDNTNLMVAYLNVSDVPPNPRDFNEPAKADVTNTAQPFGVGDESQYFGRGRGRRYSQIQSHRARFPQHVHNVPGSFPQPAQPAPQLANTDLQQILASLKAKAAPQTAAPPPPMPTMAPPYMGGQPSAAPFQPQAPMGAAPDISSILAQLTNTAPQAAAPLAPPMGQYGAPPMGAPSEPPAPLPYKYKTKRCLYWLRGKCLKGDQCSFLHE